MITGTDYTSIKVMNLLNDKLSHKEIADITGISIDNVKRLSRYNNILKKSKNCISSDSYKKLRRLGTKSLVLNQIVKEDKFDQLEELLSAVPDEIKRDDLSIFVKEIMKKCEIEQELSIFDKPKTSIEKNNVGVNYSAHDFYFRTIAKEYIKETQLFAIEYIGMHDENWALLKRINYAWQSTLKKEGILNYNSNDYVWEITDINKFLKSAERRIKSNKQIKFDIDSISDYQRRKYKINTLFIFDKYKHVTDAFIDLRNEIISEAKNHNTYPYLIDKEINSKQNLLKNIIFYFLIKNDMKALIMCNSLNDIAEKLANHINNSLAI